jgi:uncharacterized membrane protein
MEEQRNNGRHPELDILRTLAIVLMVVYHGAYDLSAYYAWDIPVTEGGWLMLARVTASLFLLLAGMSLVVAHERARARGLVWKRHLRRSAQVLAAALAVSMATWVVDPETYVRFGILHLIGVGILLLPLFTRLREGNLLVGALVLGAGAWVQTHTIPSSLLLPLGVMYPGFRSVDYFPIFPWFGVMLIGTGLGQLLYVRLAKQAPELHPFPSWLTWPGRHSLFVYLIHQPIILAVLALVMNGFR